MGDAKPFDEDELQRMRDNPLKPCACLNMDITATIDAERARHREELARKDAALRMARKALMLEAAEEPAIIAIDAALAPQDAKGKVEG